MLRDGLQILFLPLLLKCTTARCASTSWQGYVRAPKGTLIRPDKIISTVNNVSNADAILTADERYATLSRAPGTSNASSPTILIDFGQNVVGFPIFNFTGADSNGTGIRVAFSETLEYLGNTSDFSRSYNGDAITPGTDQHIVPTSPSTWIDSHGCASGSQVCADGLHGFRYLKVWLDALESDAPLANPYGTVYINSIALNFTAFLGTPETFTGWFECSDEELTQYWYDAAFTNDMNVDTFLADYVDPRNASSPSLLDKQVLFDGAKRDRDPYVGDLAVSARSLYLTHSEQSVAARNVLADLAAHQRSDGWIPPASINNYTLPIFDYPLWWVSCSYDYIIYTGDIQYAQTYYPVFEKVLNTYYTSVTNTSTKLLWKDSDAMGDYAFLPRNGTVAYYNALYIKALNEASQIATILRTNDSNAEEWSQRASTVSSSLTTHLWDPSAGAYLDSDTGPIRHAQDGNSIAILAGATNHTLATSALTYISQHASLPYGNAFYDTDALGQDFSKRVYAFISYFEIQARFMTGQPDSATDEIKRLYGWMSARDPGITMWEGIGANGSYYEEGYTSCAHGWSTGVLPALTNYVLGVQATGLGFSTWVVRPVVPGNVTWARGAVPTPGGGLGVEWEVGGNGTAFEINVDAPEGTKGDVAVPAAEGSRVLVDGDVAWDGTAHGYDASFAEGYVTVGVEGGSVHTVTVT